ncbi:MAG: toprim domain-containing protein, partial [Gammaproteobacteria bacterium]
MARITEEELERIKEEVSLVRLVEAKGIALEKKGSDYHGCCPFHDDKTPSLVVTPSKNLFHCFGCGAAGSVIDWVMKIEGVSVRHALEILKADYLPSVSSFNATGKAKPTRRNTSVKLPSLVASEDHQALLQKVVDYYHQCLKESPEAIEYLEKRGINNPELIEKFKLGYANRTLGYRLPQKNRAEGAKVRGQLQEIGILRESGHEHFNGSLVVPVINDGSVREVYGRKIKRELRKGTPKHLYLPGEHQGVWNSEALKDNCEIILCESLIDAMTFWVHGFRNVTTSYGTNGFTDEILQSLVANNVGKVLIAYDRDKAGDEAAHAISKRLA